MAQALSETELLKYLEEGLELDAAEWPAWLDRLNVTPESQARLRQLLASRTRAGALDDAFSPAHTLGPGDRIGHFQLLDPIGAGGMGQVFRARRVAGDFDQEVAIKLVGRGLKSAGVIALFENERRILAGLNHPNIATLFDGGQTPDGSPYVVMELVHGVPITDYVRTHDCSPSEVLELFVGVCEGLQTAHSALVIHRDIKPSNVLVTESGVAKILDFGIAKQIDADPGQVTRSSSMTPLYASPEQLRGQRLTTASDVYALGTLLYELLTGQRPIPGDSLTAVQLDQAIAAGNIRPASEQVRTDDPETSRQLRGDLDAILLKTLEEDARRRYSSAGELATDLRRYLEGLPVDALPRSRSYVLRRFVSRNRLAVTSLVAAFAAISAGLVAALWQFEIAQREQNRAHQINELLESVLLSPSQWSTLTHANELVVDRDASIVDLWTLLERQIADRQVSADIKVEVLTTLCESYLNLDLWDDAVRAGESALAIADEESTVTPANRVKALRYLTFAKHKRKDPDTSAAYLALLEQETSGLDHGGDLKNYAVWLRERGDHQQASDYFDRSIAVLESSGDDLSTAFAYGSSALLQCDLGRFEACAERLRKSIDLWASTGQGPNASLHRAMASAELGRGGLESALRHAAIAARAGEEVTPGTLEHLRALVVLLEAQVLARRLDAARRTLDQARAIQEELLPPDHPERAMLQLQAGYFDLARGAPREALERAMRVRALLADPPRYTLLSSKVDLLEGLARDGAGTADGTALIRRARDFRADILGEDLYLPVPR